MILFWFLENYFKRKMRLFDVYSFLFVNCDVKDNA